MSVYHCDASRTLDYTLALGLTGGLYRLGARLGGRPYGVGLWNTPYLSQIFSHQQLAELRSRKRAIDPARFDNRIKYIYVVDDDVDIFDDREMTVAFVNRCQLDRDMLLLPGMPDTGIDPIAYTGRRRHPHS
jgi:hypothetical protein